MTFLSLSKLLLTHGVIVGEPRQRTEFTPETHKLAYHPLLNCVSISKEGASVLVPREHVLRMTLTHPLEARDD